MTITWDENDTYCYIACVYGTDGNQPGDCYTRVGHSWHVDVDALDSDAAYETEQEARDAASAVVVQRWWYDDGDDTVRVDTKGPYETEQEARDAASEHASDLDESEGDEDAEAMATRLLDERRGEPDSDGVWACYWETSGDDKHVVERYSTRDAAEADAELRDNALRAQYPGGRLLCGYSVRRLIDGDWVSVEDEDLDY